MLKFKLFPVSIIKTKPKDFIMKKLKKFIRFSLMGMALTGCAAGDNSIADAPVEYLYNQGHKYFQEKDFEESARYFDEVERQHPYSAWAPRAQIMTAFAFYNANKYDDAILALDRFIQLHPGNKNIAYAYYLKGLCYFEQMSDVSREQKMTEDALETFKELLYRFPNSVYVPDVNEKLKEISSHLAGKEMAVGRYYLKNKEYIPALNRFQSVILEHPNANQSSEALYRLSACYTALGMMQQATQMKNILKYYYPKSPWTEKANELLKKYTKEK